MSQDDQDASAKRDRQAKADAAWDAAWAQFDAADPNEPDDESDLAPAPDGRMEVRMIGRKRPICP